MKILLAIKSSKIERIGASIRWAGRSGYDLKIFVPQKKWEDFNDFLPELQDEYYLYYPQSPLVVNRKPLDYARKHGYDLLLSVKDSKASFTGKRKKISLGEETFKFCEAVGKGRVKLGHSTLNEVQLAPGVLLERTNKK